ncbi:MAG: hypothetical protein KY396_08135, partial [Actinobacteria bacterium]|nr:hypothetical protein [Actinomycetota bacterium]
MTIEDERYETLAQIERLMLVEGIVRWADAEGRFFVKVAEWGRVVSLGRTQTFAHLRALCDSTLLRREPYYRPKGGGQGASNYALAPDIVARGSELRTAWQRGSESRTATRDSGKRTATSGSESRTPERSLSVSLNASGQEEEPLTEQQRQENLAQIGALAATIGAAKPGPRQRRPARRYGRGVTAAEILEPLREKQQP